MFLKQGRAFFDVIPSCHAKLSDNLKEDILMRNFKFDVDYFRGQFPAMRNTVNGNQAVFMDGPGGTQLPQRVIDQMVNHMVLHNANIHGVFRTSEENDALIRNAREVFADFFNCSWDEVCFGENTSTNNFKLALAFARTWKEGDEILITDMDHEGNRSPWRTLEDFGAVVKSAALKKDVVEIDFEDFKSKLSDKTKIVAINWAANSCGTITDVKKYIAEAHKVGAIAVVDAVQYAPHGLIDVKEIDADIVLTSPYKYYGPHSGAFYCRKEVGEALKSIRVMADDNTEMPFKLETGTMCMENVSGAAEAVEFIADIGRRHAEMFEEETKGLEGRRKDIACGLYAMDTYEVQLADRMREAIKDIPGLKLYGPAEGQPQTATVSFTVEGKNANDIALKLADAGIFTWDGEFYAIETIWNVLKLQSYGGMLRIGMAPYLLESDVDRTIDLIREICCV